MEKDKKKPMLKANEKSAQLEVAQQDIFGQLNGTGSLFWTKTSSTWMGQTCAISIGMVYTNQMTSQVPEITTVEM